MASGGQALPAALLGSFPRVPHRALLPLVRASQLRRGKSEVGSLKPLLQYCTPSKPEVMLCVLISFWVINGIIFNQEALIVTVSSLSVLPALNLHPLRDAWQELPGS